MIVAITSSNVAVSTRGATAIPGVIVAGSPAGITKLRMAAFSVPTLVTLASVPGSPVVVVPIVMVAAAPSTTSVPAGPTGPAGIPKFKTTFSDVPLFVTEAWLPAGNVVVLPMLTVAALGSPSGITKFKIAFVAVPVLGKLLT